jgi:Na+-transporting methylmalonyl-CoA/oxaloacetate decarboxylase gamma subunit
MNDAAIAYRDEEIEPPVSVSHLVHVLRAYASVILLAVVGVAFLYAVIALLIFVMAPSEKVISQPFRLDFPRATEGKYPNGLKFSTAEITSSQTLVKVYKDAQIGRFMTFPEFASGIYITQSNPAYDRLQREYMARLNDPKLGPVDRQQIERDYADKLDALPKNLYAISFTGPYGTVRLPDDVAYRALSDILSSWADWAQTKGQVTSYDTAVLSPSVLDEEPNTNLVVAIRVMIKKLSQVLDNLDEVSALPSAALTRTSDHMSVAELHIKIEDMIRFQLEPMVQLARGTRSASDPYTLRFVQTQLAFDQRQLQSYQDRVDAIRNAIFVYTNQRAVSMESPTSSRGADKGSTGSTETVMPQLNETFIDRLAQMLNQSADVLYRQKMVDEMRRIQSEMVPVQESVRYDEELLRDVTVPAAPIAANEADLRIQLNETRNHAKVLIAKINEIYTIVSHNLNPDTYLYTITAPPKTLVLRSVPPSRLVLIGAVVVLLSIPIIILFCFIHHRVREEEQGTVAVTP